MSHPASTDDPHRAADLLLPWYVTGRLDPADIRLVETHLATCAACRATLADERRLATALAASTPETDRGWEKMRARLGQEPVPAARRRSRRWLRPPGRADRVRWLVAAQFAGLLLLGGILLTAPRDPYRALGDAPAARSGNVLAMFAPTTSAGEMRRVLDTAGARIVDGPTAAGAYLLAVPDAAGGARLAALRRERAVTMAEPITETPATE